MQKLLFLFLVAVIFAFQLERLYGSGGAIDDGRIKNEIIRQTEINQDLINRNNEMIIKTSGLKGSPDAIEARARLELNMVKHGETLILLPGNDRVLTKSPTTIRNNKELNQNQVPPKLVPSSHSSKKQKPNTGKMVHKIKNKNAKLVAKH